MECLLFKDLRAMSSLEGGIPIKNALNAISSANVDSQQTPYFKDGQHVYYEVKTFAYIKDKRLFFLLEGSDPQTFIALSKNYARDRNNIYFHENNISVTDLHSFQTLPFDYAKDSKHAYFQGKRLNKEIQVNFFEVLSNAYAKDLNKVIYRGNEVIEAHASSFADLDWGYAKDAHQVYLNGTPLQPHFSPDSFEVLSEFYIKDKQLVYWDDWHIAEADLPSFLALNAYYAKDKNHVYLQGRILKGADPHTFKIIQDEWLRPRTDGQVQYLDNWYTKDANSVYYYNKPIPHSDPDSFTLLTEYYAKDSHHVYFNNQIITEADPNTFVVLDKYYTKDHQNTFYNFVADDDIEPFCYISMELYVDLETIIGQDDGIYYLKGTPEKFYNLVSNAPVELPETSQKKPVIENQPLPQVKKQSWFKKLFSKL